MAILSVICRSKVTLSAIYDRRISAVMVDIVLLVEYTSTAIVLMPAAGRKDFDFV
jgi:hypothetical protein